MSDTVYSRFRFERYYNFVATVDCVGCNLNCLFCFTRDKRKLENIDSNDIRNGSWNMIMPKNIERNCFSKIEKNMKYKFFVLRSSPEAVFEGLNYITKHCFTNHYRISGGEPTLHFEHLLEILRLFKEKRNKGGNNFYFILETNGIRLGQDPRKVLKLKEFNEFLHVRISFKTPTEERYQKITRPRGGGNYHKDPYYALKNCMEQGISVHPVLMRELIGPNDLSVYVENLKNYTTDGEPPNSILKKIEFERLFLYNYILHRFKESDDEKIQKLVEGIDFDIN